MELLPIIYWSLFGAALLAGVVIVISFFTFRIRKKYGYIPDEEVKGEERNKKVKVKNPDKKSKAKKEHTEDRKHHPKVRTRSKQKSSSKSHRNSVKKSSSIESSLYRKPTRDSHRKRIEILNNTLEDNHETKPSSDSNKETKYHPIKVRNDWN